jgi:hypothetical protein
MFQLTKVWIDQEPGIEMVEIRYLWSPLGEPARLDPSVRKAVLACGHLVNTISHKPEQRTREEL